MRCRACLIASLGLASVVVAVLFSACRTGHTPPVLQPTPRTAPPPAAGTLRVQVRQHGTPRVLSLDLEEYVRRTMVAEMAVEERAAAWAAPIYEAQAIVARTYALASLGRHAEEGFDLCATTHCQVFQDRPPPTRWDDTIDAAVEATRGLVLAYEGQPIRALFHAHCGGHTSDADLIWPGTAVPYLRGVPDPFCQREQSAAWSFQIEASSLARALDGSPDTGVGGRVDGIEVVERDEAGRVVLVALTGARRALASGEALRSAIMRASGPASLRSPRYTVRRDGDTFRFDGEGSGHGAGLCQIGMVGRLKAGHTPEEVLTYYFQGASLTSMDALRVVRTRKMRDMYELLLFCLVIITAAYATGVSATGAQARDEPEPPVAEKAPHVRERHGDRFVDDYFWLREKSNPEVVRYLDAENAYTRTVMKPLEALQETLYEEMLGRIKETDLSVPSRQGDYWYYTRTEEGRQYEILCRKKGHLDAPEEIYLDVNALAEGEPFMSLGVVEVSDDGHLVAYSTDNTGFREYRLHVKDLRTGTVIESPAEQVTSVAWASDNETLFYTTPDAAKRSYRLYRHTMGQAEDPLLYEETDERFRVYVSRSRSKDFLFLEASSHTTSEVHYLQADQPGATWQVVAPREDAHEYDVDHRGDRFYIRTNQDGRNFSLVTAPVDHPGRGHWEALIPSRADVMLERVIPFRDHLVLAERARGLPTIRVQRFGETPWRAIPFPEPVYTSAPMPGLDFDTTTLRYRYQSFITPRSVLEYDMETGRSTLLKEDEVLGGYDRTKYVSERIEATATDGTKIPISLLYSKGVTRDGRAPVLLTAYGAYGLPNNVTFSSNRLSLVDRGVVYALAHVRGGGDLGKPWHDEGRMLTKKNTFTDFIAAAEHLVAERYGAEDRLVIQGGSAGGLLMGAVTNMRPDLFTAVVTDVPFVDVINTMSDPSVPLTVGELEEWGDPANQVEYDYIASYCPYTNIERKAYPAMLVNTSLHDSQVMYWEPAKYVARLRARKTDTRPLMLKTNMAGGHGGSSGRYDRLREVAFDYAFVLWQAGVEEVED